MAKKKSKNNEFDYDYSYDYDINDGKKKEEKTEKAARGPEKGAADENTENKQRKESSLGVQIVTAILVVLGVFIILCFAFSGSDDKQIVGAVGGFIGRFLLGILGGAALVIPVYLFIGALRLKRDTESGKVVQNIIFTVLSVIFASVLIHTFSCIFGASDALVIDKGTGSFFDGLSFGEGLKQLYISGTKFVGGGFIGGLTAVALISVVGKAGSLIFSILFFAIFMLCLFGATPASLWSRVKFYIVRQSERRAAHEKKEKKPKKSKNPENEQVYSNYRNYTPTEHKVVKGQKRSPDDDIDYGETLDERTRKMNNIDSFSFSDTSELTVYNEKLKPVNTNASDKNDFELSDIFDMPVDDDISSSFSTKPLKPVEMSDTITEASLDVPVKGKSELAVKRTQTRKSAVVVTPPPAEVVPEEPAYVFPPIDYLQYKSPADEGNIEHELRNNAQKLVETLESFNIHTKVVNISRGPAVTRYEIAPEIGTRVSAIVNRVDDISLGLASSVLIEGVIPGKSAIGIEVPNKNVSTVYLRELIDDDQFRSSKSKLTTSLGIDLTGTKIYLDVAKMPHLLIAGATGTGKSVCMNSLIVSLLYKSTPDEVKFILIDPKKVEFNIYDGLPHLLVPVVSDPKKAAGALNWCVTEMERRYDILEAHSKRNLAQYNEATANDPSAERLPQIVIIIDELADLMLTARDVVETSIARIAAKARAAGMHLIIGTQRPSVDVITGTIKSNIPSRIACTVKSQIDSRTILDQAGAEKLVGRGDMLYAPVGARMPMRVQGAFVDEKEIEDIVGFIKEHAGVCEYDREIAEQIEKEAEMCGRKGKAAPGEGGMGDPEEEDDPMLDDAIKLAIEEKKISTSLIQRRLQLGYGRAAKLIDIMEARGIVSAPNGQKPRDVLISYEDYLEMSMHSD